MDDYQKILFPYSYNILGSVEDARDAVQEVISNFVSAERKGIENVKGYLIKGVVNQSINIKTRRREVRSENVWLPEPFATEEADTNINLRDIASYSLMVLLEQLNPKERAVFILKESFDYTHQEIAEVIASTEEHSRKLLSRAKEKLRELKLKKTFAGEPISISFIEKYINAIRRRDTKTLEAILTDDIIFYADGGDKLQVVKKTCSGKQDVADLLIFVHHKFHMSHVAVYATINHQPAILYYNSDELIACQVLGISIGQNKIRDINTIVDPEKLKALNSRQRTASS
jgi:RNA polymerase sigma factor (sigma-70 family)